MKWKTCGDNMNVSLVWGARLQQHKGVVPPFVLSCIMFGQSQAIVSPCFVSPNSAEKAVILQELKDPIWSMTEHWRLIYLFEVHPFFCALSLSNLVDNIIYFRLPEQKWEIQLYKPIPLFHSNNKWLIMWTSSWSMFNILLVFALGHMISIFPWFCLLLRLISK